MNVLTTVLPDHSLKSMSEVIGKLPAGDVPAAWYLSLEPNVIEAYRRWQRNHKAWRDRLTELCERSGLGTTEQIRISGLGNDYLQGIYSDVKPVPQWWRRTKEGYLVPRKRTQAEKNSEISQRFAAVRHIPLAINYLPGMPNVVWCDNAVYSPQVRMPAKAVLVFLGVTPEMASERFEPGPQWSRMKLSIYHLLLERQRQAQEGGR